MLIIMFLDLVVWIIFLENWIRPSTIGNTMEIIYPKGLGTFGPPNHISYDVLGLGGLDYHLG